MAAPKICPDSVVFHDFAIPAGLAAMAGPLDQFGQVADSQVAALRRYGGLDHARYIVEVGCGFGRDAIPLVGILPIDAKYLGIGGQQDEVDWAHSNITARAPNFEFVRSDPGEEPFHLPLEPDSQDLVFAFSVFASAYPELVQEHLDMLK